MHKIYGYTRGIHIDKRHRERDVQKQDNAIRRYAARLIQMYPDLILEGIYSDEGQRKSGQNIRTMPAGKKLLVKIGRMDHLIIGHYSRVFSTPRQFLRNLALWKRQGIKVHLAQNDLKVCMNTPAGMLLRRLLEDMEAGEAVFTREVLHAREWRRTRGLGGRIMK